MYRTFYCYRKAGIRIGKLYTELRKFGNYAFNGGVFAYVGLGGLISAGGRGGLVRTYGLAIDQALKMDLILNQRCKLYSLT